MPSGNKASEKLSQTMRIDIAPQSLESPTIQRKHTRIITRKSKSPDDRDMRTTGLLASADSDFQQLLQGLYDAALITDGQGKIIDANARAAERFLYSRDDLRKLTVFDLVSAFNDALLDQIRENLAERFVVIEGYCARKDDTFFPAEIAVSQIRLSEKDLLCFFARDITIRREKEEQLLIEDTAIQNSTSGIAITDLDLNIKYANPAVSAMWGYDEDDDLVDVAIESLLELPDGVENTLHSIVEQEERWVREFVATRKDSSSFDLQITATCLRDSDEDLVGVVFSFVDISDRKIAEEATKEAERHKVMLESLGAACHHLAQPATILVANLGIMKKNVPDDSRELLTQVSACADAAESLSDILHRLNAVNEYRTTPYLEDREDSDENRILDI